MSLLVLAGPHRGEVWFDGRGTDDGVFAIAPSFKDFLHEWVQLMVHGGWPRTFTTPGHCAMPAALTSFLHGMEDKHGVARGQMPPALLQSSLASIPDGGIANAATGDPFWNDGDLVDLCPICARTLENLCAQGMRPGA